MSSLLQALRLSRMRRLLPKLRPASRGNVLVYVVLVMVIFGALGVAMVSLFSPSITSSATRNDHRRAFYMVESGIRYGVSVLRDKDFASQTIDDLNTTTFKLPPGEFKLNVTGSFWFESASNQSLSGSPPAAPLDLVVTEGKIPTGFLEQIPTAAPFIRLVNRDYINFDPGNPNMRFRPPETGIAQVSGVTPGDHTTFQLSLNDDFVAAKGEELCLAALPASAGQTINVGGSFDLETSARTIFPRLGGAFEVRKRNFSYREARDLNDRIQLIDIQPVSGEKSDPESNIQLDEGLILTSRNHLVTAEGKYGDVVLPATAGFSTAVADRSVVKPKTRKPDIAFEEEPFLDTVLRQVEQVTKTGFVDVDNTARSLTIGGGTGPSLGAVWFRDTRNIGGKQNFCQTEATATVGDPKIGCFFNEGIRVFFELEYAGSGDGFVFSLINGNPNKNDTASIGGDIERSEMLGYAGDSRLAIDGSEFLDNSGPARGLIPPKIGLEFDTKVNYTRVFEETGAYCASATSLNENTRNDPGTPAADNRDAVQFVYWGANALTAACRKEPFCGGTPGCTGDPSYDDNRHDAFGAGDQNWIFDTGDAIQSSPHIAADGTIFVGSDSTIFYALNPDGSEKWRVDRSGAWFSPTVIGTGPIYVGTGSPESRLFALRQSDGLVLWSFFTSAFGSITTKPAVKSDGTVIIGADDGALRAVESPGGQIWRFDVPGPAPPYPIKSSPALSASGNTVYFGTANGLFFAIRADNADPLRGNPRWFASPGGAGAFNSSPVVGPDGTVYVGNDDGKLYAFDGAIGGNRPGFPFSAGAAVRSSPVLSSDGSVVYFGTSNGTLFAVNTATGGERWRFTGASGPIESPITVDVRGHIYFGSNDDKIYGLYADGIQKFSFATNGDVVAKPAVKDDGTIYAASRDGKVYAINQFANPKNRKDLLITSAGQSVGGVPVAVTSENNWLNGSSSKGPWTVRLEVERGLTQVSGTYPYRLRAWVRQCNTANCNDPTLFDPLGTLFEDTRVQYYSQGVSTTRPPMLEQTVNLSPSDHEDFERFIFGFTAQTAGGDLQTATIRKFQLSFIRPNDPIVVSDPGWP